MVSLAEHMKVRLGEPNDMNRVHSVFGRDFIFLFVPPKHVSHKIVIFPFARVCFFLFHAIWAARCSNARKSFQLFTLNNFIAMIGVA